MGILEKIDWLCNQDPPLADKQPFNYSAVFATGVTFGTTGSAIVTVQSDSHFLCRFANITTYASAAGIPIVVHTGLPALEIAYLDSGAGRNMQDNAQPIQNLMGGVAAGAGNGSLPFVWPEPWLIRAASTVQISLNNIGRETYPRVVVSLIGFKVFRYGGGAPPAELG